MIATRHFCLDCNETYGQVCFPGAVHHLSAVHCSQSLADSANDLIGAARHVYINTNFFRRVGFCFREYFSRATASEAWRWRRWNRVFGLLLTLRDPHEQVDFLFHAQQVEGSIAPAH